MFQRTLLALVLMVLLSGRPSLADLQSEPAMVLQGLSCPYQLAFGDFNNDGRVDLAVACWAPSPDGGGKYDQERSRVLLFHQKDGKFTSPPDRELKVPSPWGMAAGDLDGDGKTDLVVKGNSRVLHLFLGAEDFRVDHESVDINDSDRNLQVARLSPDGKADFLCGPVWRKWYGGDRFTVGYCHGPTENDNRTATVADLNRDGRNDIVFVAGDRIRLCYGPFMAMIIRPSELAQTQEIRPPLPAHEVRVADMNGDGRPDLVAALRDPQGRHGCVAVFEQSAPMGFAVDHRPALEMPGLQAPLLLDDLNRDGLADLLANDAVHGRLVVFMQCQGQALGNGPADAYQSLNVRAYALQTADVNADGFPDLAVSDGHAVVAVYLNDGQDHRARRPATAVTPGKAGQETAEAAPPTAAPAAAPVVPAPPATPPPAPA